MELERKKIIQGLIGRIYYVRVVTDMELGIHTVKIYTENPDTEPETFKIFGILPVTIDPPPVEPIIERTYPLAADIQKRIEELIYYHELPEIQLMRLDEWDGIVRPPKRQPEPEEPVEEPLGNPEPEQENRPYLIRIKDWKDPNPIYYDPVNKRAIETNEDAPEDIEEVS